MPPRSARPAASGTGPPTPASAGPAAAPGRGDESPVVRRSLVDRTSHLFEAGTNSAETPRTGASAPSLNSMGADSRVASQPVVRRLLTSNDESQSSARQEPSNEHEIKRVQADDGELFERIVDALEQRVLDELERRGRRHSPGVF